MPDDDIRWYRQRWTSLGIRVAEGACVAGASLLVFGSARYGNPDALTAGALAAVFGVIVIWMERRATKQGVYESDAGLTLVTMVNRRSIAWEDIELFEDHRKGTWDQVFARLENGRYVLLPGILQGQRVVWDGDETRDIVSVLNERLRARIGSRPPAWSPGDALQ